MPEFFCVVNQLKFDYWNASKTIYEFKLLAQERETCIYTILFPSIEPCLFLHCLRTFQCLKKNRMNPTLFHLLAPFTRVRTNFCTDKNLYGSTLRFHGTGRTGQNFERLSVQVWDLKKVGQLFDLQGADFVPTGVNTRTVQLFAQIARLRPRI